MLLPSTVSPISLPGINLAYSFLVANQPTVGPPNDIGEPIDWPSDTTISNPILPGVSTTPRIEGSSKQTDIAPASLITLFISLKSCIEP